MNNQITIPLAPFAPVIGCHPERSWRRRMSRGRFLVQTLPPDATMSSPHADDQHHRQRQEASETEPAFCQVYIGHGWL
jgi:hypothetical protein